MQLAAKNPQRLSVKDTAALVESSIPMEPKAKKTAKPKAKAGGKKKGDGAKDGGAKAKKPVISIEKSRSRVKAWTGIKGQGQYGLFPYKDAKGLESSLRKAKQFLGIK